MTPQTKLYEFHCSYCARGFKIEAGSETTAMDLIPRIQKTHRERSPKCAGMHGILHVRVTDVKLPLPTKV